MELSKDLSIETIGFKHLKALHELEQKKWSIGAATIALLNERIANSPNFSWGVFNKSGEALASCFVMGTQHAKVLNSKNWFESTDNGTASSHDPQAKIWFGISLSGEEPQAVDLLLKEVTYRLLCQGIRAVYLGAPTAGLHKWKEKHHLENIESYVFHDPLISYYCRLGFKIVKVMPNYFPHSGAEDYAVLLRLSNPFYLLAPLIRRVKKDFLINLMNKHKYNFFLQKRLNKKRAS